MLLELLSDGRLHLSGVGTLASHLTEDNCESLLARASHKSKRQIEELLAELSPKPDVPAVIRKLPSPSRPASNSVRATQLGPDRVHALPAKDPSPLLPAPARSVAVTAPPAVKPLAPARYKVQFTASNELREKLERLQALLQGDLAQVIEAAVTEKLERLEAKRYAETKSARKDLTETDTSPRSRYIPAAVKREVRRRDGDECRFVNEKGKRCTEKRGLEFHHHNPFGRGGDHNPEHVSLMCRAHNAYLAERDYGEKVMRRYRGGGGRVSEPAPVYCRVPAFGLSDSRKRDSPRHRDTARSAA